MCYFIIEVALIIKSVIKIITGVISIITKKISKKSALFTNVMLIYYMGKNI